MCTILYYGGSQFSAAQVQEHLLAAPHRGPDGARVLDTGLGWLGFARLAIMGLEESGMQPFVQNDCMAVCNGEIYGFRKLKEELSQRGYRFLSGSDCEVLLPLYQEYGLEMFRHLDAEFACVIVDPKHNRVIAARDPIGIRPLYYGYSSDGMISFASEPQNLLGLVETILPFPPGCYYCNGTFHTYDDLSQTDRFIHEDETAVTAQIHDLLTKAVLKRLDSDAPLGFLLSGGLDSSLVCAIAAKHSTTPIRTFAIGMEHDAIDLKYAAQTAAYLGTAHTEIIITREDVLSHLDEVIRALATYDITTIRASMGMYLLCKAIHHQTDLKVLLTGEVSDELFGYKYTDFAPDAASFYAESQKRVRELHAYDVLRADRCLAANSLEARVPFGDLDFARYVMSIDPYQKMNHHQKGKYLLRKAFENDHLLPDEILWREKAAFSDAVGHSLVDDLKQYAEETYTDEEFAKLCLKYDYAAPFTKESLLYREIFERHYPGQAGMIPGFWMPNQSWEGCRVNDPSARVLSNYGASGQ